jgi:PiT family inorganic phosphate transporter
MDFFAVFTVLALLSGFLMSFSLGANDAANAMASAVGAKAITIRQAVVIASVMNFVGAVFLGAHVTATISEGIVNLEKVADPKLVTIGMFSALLTAGLFVLISTITGFPVSSTHSVIGGMIGFGIMSVGFSAVKWVGLTSIFLSWIISPALGGLMAYFIYFLIKKSLLQKKDLFQAARIWCPIWMGITALIIVSFVILETHFGDEMQKSIPLSVFTLAFFGLFVWSQGRLLINEFLERLERRQDAVENVFRRLQVFTSSYVALAQGSNDVANALGPVVAIYMIAKTHHLPDAGQVPIMLMMLGGFGIALGVTMLGHRVISTVGTGITKLNNTRGFSVDFSLATTVLFASRMGLPVSSTTVAVGAVTGVGLAQGKKSVDLMMLVRIVGVWVLTVPITALASMGIFWVLKAIFF